uniref:Polyketide synthase/peptide synthetase n=1 Tax=Ganoderma boninense TaxID=34458 RepID=A0A5K1K501_9APHY|nr:Polyketide synthase/peptide synthetase [Ganoderma boninense]
MIAHEWFAHAEGLGRGSDAYDLALSPTAYGSYLAAAPEGYTDLVMIACAWSPDGELIASASSRGTVRVWDALTFQQRDAHDDTGFHPKHLQFSPNARYLVWTSSSINIWSRPEEDQRKRQRPLVQLNYDAAINALSFNPESTRIVTAHGHLNGKPEDYVVRIWDIATGAVLALLAGHTAIVKHASFSPDGRSILSIQASPDGLARIWDAVSWRETLSFKTDGGTGCFSPCGKYIVTRGAQVKLWRASDGLWLVTFTEHKGYVSHVVFSPNGEFLASGDLDGIVHIRRLSNFL